MHDWLQTPPGHYLLEWERARIDATVADIFGYHALQLGVPELDGLQANRMPHKWLALESAVRIAPSARQPALLCDFCALPFAANSLDLVLMPHTLESSADPHASLREVERVLVPEGRVLICGFNAASLWGFRQKRGHLHQKIGVDTSFLPTKGATIGYWRLRDWLGLLGFEIEIAEFGCYRPGVKSEYWLQRLAWMDATGARWWPIFGAVYFLVAVKRVRGMRLMEPSWKKTPVTVHNPASVANRCANHATDIKT